MTIWSLILWILAGLFLWATLDLLLGRKKHLSSLKIEEFPFRSSNMKIFAKGPELFDDLFSELKNAKQHIHALFYIVQDDKMSQAFLDILMEKARDGLEVRLLVDWMGSGLASSQIQSLKEAGVQFAFSNKPSFPFLFYSSQVRNHRKIAVIDGKLGYFGGFNIGKEYCDMDPVLSPWRDYHVKLTGEGTADLQVQFLRDWYKNAKVNLLQNSIYFPELTKGTILHQFVSTEGTQLEPIMAKLLADAKQSIIIGSPYFVPSKKVFPHLLKALENGVVVTILVPCNADHILVKEASYPYLRLLLKNGARIYQFSEGFYHAKVLIIDDKVCDIGTANFDKRSMLLNAELNCLIFDHSFIEKLKTVLNEDLAKSRKVLMSDFTHGNLFLIIKEQLAKIASIFF